MATIHYHMDTLADEESTGPCEECGREAPFVFRDKRRRVFFCCACNLEYVGGDVDPDCTCAFCEAERVRYQIEVPDCTCENCVRWRAQQRRH